MSALPDVDWNELVILARHQGEFSLWGAWKRGLAGFADPRLWESTEHWETYFRPLPQDTAWGPAGYGLVVMDLDTKTAWSMNDYSHPGAIAWVEGHQRDPADESGVQRALQQLLARPDQWEHVTLRLHKERLTDLVPGVATKVRITKHTLANLLSPEMTAEQRLARMTPQFCKLNLPEGKHLVLSTEFLPGGWQLQDVRGRSDLDVLGAILAHTHAQGFPAPSDELVQDWVNHKLAHEDEEEAEQERSRFTALLGQWSSPTAKGSAPRA